MTGADAEKKRILVVEDEPAICRVCSRTLAGEGFEVDIAANGGLAEGMLKGYKDYDLVFIDIRTPVMNGKQLYKCIAEEHPELAGRVVFTTGDITGDIKGFLDKSGRPYLPKPFTPDELKAIIKYTLGQVNG